MTAGAVRVGIAGAGAIAFGTAALLAANGHAPMLWSPSGAGTRALTDDAPLVASGAVERSGPVGVAADAAALAAFADVLLIALPATGHRAVIEALAPHLRHGQSVIVSSCASFGTLHLARLLAARGLRLPLIAWGTTVVSGRRDGPAAVRVNTVRGAVDVCATPHAETPAAVALCERLFGTRFVARDGLLAVTLSNLNPQNHLGIALANMTRMERGENWGQGENVTPNVGRLLEALDRERLAIAGALGLETKTIFQHFARSFHVPEDSISAMNQRMAAEGRGGVGPATADSRYVTEDAPFGLAVTVALGEMAGRPAPLHAAGLALLSAMYGRDFAAENDLLPVVAPPGTTLAALDRLCREGPTLATTA